MRKLLAGITLLVLCVSVMPVQAYAFDPFGRGGSGAAVNCSSGSDEQKSTVCQTTNTDPLTGPNGVLVKLTHVIAFFAGAVAVILVIVGGIRYMIATGDAAGIKSARDTVINALIGIVIIVLAQAIITFVISRL